MENSKTINIVELAGLLYNQPTGKVTTNSFVAKFMLQIKNAKGNGFKLVPITVWGEQGEKLVNSFVKGDQIHITGELETGSYKNKEGATVYTWGVLAKEIHTEATPF